MVNSLYNESKAAQATAVLVGLGGGKMNLLKLVKLLYAAERESLDRWLRPLTYDKLVSMPRGQVVSYTYNRIKENQNPRDVWGQCFKITGTRIEKTVHLINDCTINALSRAELELIKEIYLVNKDKSPKLLEDEHHNQKITPEWVNPNGSSLKTDYAKLLPILGKNSDEIKEFFEDLEEAAFIKSISC